MDFSKGSMETGNRKRGRASGAPNAPAAARLVPAQKRSRERFERILACTVDLLSEKGSDAFRMSDIVERTGVPFGSLYQYFPDKSAIFATLAERYNAVGRECVKKELSALTSIADLHRVLCRITESYYQFFIDEPAVLGIWQATQADRVLQKLDEQDGLVLSGLLVDALSPVVSKPSHAQLTDFCQILMVQIAAAVRHAITLPPPEGRRILDLFARMLPRDLAALEA